MKFSDSNMPIAEGRLSYVTKEGGAVKFYIAKKGAVAEKTFDLKSRKLSAERVVSYAADYFPYGGGAVERGEDFYTVNTDKT